MATLEKQARRKKGPQTTTYKRILQVKEIVDGFPVTLALQKRTAQKVEHPWYTLSWRTRYSPGGSNRRFYMTKNGCWTIPIGTALNMIRQMKALGGLDENYFDIRRRPCFTTLVSTELAAGRRVAEYENLTAPDEDWGEDPFFVVAFDPHESWKKAVIVHPQTGVATFRSITSDPSYSPKKVLRPGEGWWLDNSMMDANVQQMLEFSKHLEMWRQGTVQNA
jgi:hypothetical protein